MIEYRGFQGFYRVVVFLSLLWTSLAQAQGFWWHLQGEGREAFLGGSVHMGSESMYPLPAPVMEAFAQADVLVVEIDIREGGGLAAMGQIFEIGIYRDGSSLQDHVDDSTWALLQETLDHHGLPRWLFRWQKPWFAAMNLTVLAFRQAGYREDLGVDMHFLEAAAASEKPIEELESVASQLGLFKNLSAAEQEAFLQQTLRDLDRGPDYLDGIMDAWIQGDAETLEELVLAQLQDDTPEAQRFYELFFRDRNLAMGEAVQELMDQGLVPFVVVGAGHLVGEDGLVEMFRARGNRLQSLLEVQSP